MKITERRYLHSINNIDFETTSMIGKKMEITVINIEKKSSKENYDPFGAFIEHYPLAFSPSVGDTESGPKSDILGQAGVGIRTDRCPYFPCVRASGKSMEDRFQN